MGMKYDQLHHESTLRIQYLLSNNFLRRIMKGTYKSNACNPFPVAPTGYKLEIDVTTSELNQILAS
jgi:hypothetical protein